MKDFFLFDATLFMNHFSSYGLNDDRFKLTRHGQKAGTKRKLAVLSALNTLRRRITSNISVSSDGTNIAVCHPTKWLDTNKLQNQGGSLPTDTLEGH